MQKINLLGMDLTDYSLRESIGITDRFLGSGSLNTILFISARMLVGAGISDEQKEWIEDTDLIIWSDAEIIKQAGIKAKDRIHEVENQGYIRELLKRLGRGKKSVYLLAESEEELAKLKADLLHLRGDLNIVGGGTVGYAQEAWENEANRINMIAPAAIISRMEFAWQEKLMAEMKRFLNADVWVALNHQMTLRDDRKFSLRKIWNKWYHLLFQKQLESYSQTENRDTDGETEEQ